MNAELERDVMQVCLRGHVITDMLLSHPEQAANHCDRCGAPTLCHCQTCGQDIPGASALPGLVTIGRRPAPQYCPGCGAAFPWADRPLPAEGGTLAVLETVLRRLPCAIRQLRDRHDSRPTLKVADEYDLEDLLRAVLHLHFDNVRRELRTPSYCTSERTDFIVGRDDVAVVAKLATSPQCEAPLAAEIEEDLNYYERLGRTATVLVLVYDPEQALHEPRRLEAQWSQDRGEFQGRCIIA